ncbi:hypothetical protein ACP8HI_06170 [Paenibacillus sp. FA6]|uniref:hypothetical protein n=1 Tax=Paenibacillus sp. FA6 TaxID=3413029 RepID=UPI003F65C2CD
MIRSKKSDVIKFVATFLFSLFVALFLMGLPESHAYADVNTPELTIGDFESTDEAWDFLIGSSGALGNGEFSRDSTNAQSGSSSGKLQLNFSSNSGYTNSYVSLEKYLFKRVLPTDAVELSLWVKTADMAKFDLILVDNSNQNHQQTIILDQTTEWQKITVSSFTSGVNYTKWGGSNDGVWHGPLKKMHFKLTKASMKAGKTIGSIWIDNIRVKVEVPELAIAQVQVGNVFAGSQSAHFDIVTTGDAIQWSTFNAWGEPVSTGTAPVTGSKLRLNVPVAEDGYYRLKVVASLGGAVINTKETTFATLPEFDLAAVTESPFGVQTHYGISWNKEMIPLLKYAGTKNVRDSFYWSEVEVNKGQYSFNPKVTLPMQSFNEFGIDPFLSFAFSNKYYDEGKTPYTEEAHLAYGNYVKAMLGKFGSQIKSGEIWNEFNLPYFGGNGPADSRADIYFNMLKKGYEASKSVHPELNVVGGATAGIPEDWLEDLFELGGLDYMDALSVHPYRYPQTPEGLLEEIDALNQLVRDHNDGKTIPLWFSEIGWPTHLNPTGVDETTQAAYLIRTYVLSIAAGVEKIFWYNLMDTGTDKLNNEHNFGVIHNTGDALGAYTPKPAYVALATLTRQLTGANPVSQDIEDGIYYYTFDKNSEKINVLWSLDKKDITLNTQAPLLVTDMMGRKITYTPIQGKVYLTLTGEPLFIQGDMDSLVQSSPFSLHSDSVYTNDPVTLVLQVSDLAQQEELVARVSFEGITQEISVKAPGDYTVEFPEIDKIGYKKATATLLTTERMFVGLSETVEIQQAEQVSSKHVIKNGADVMEVTIVNERPTERQLTQIDWSFGSSTGSEVYDVVIPGNTLQTVDFPLSGLAEGPLQAYQFKLFMEDGAVLLIEGNVKLVPSESRVPLIFRTVDSLEDLQDLMGIDLIADVNSRIGSHKGPEDFSGNLWSTYDSEHLYMVARVHDDVFSQSKQGDEIWAGDSIQFAVSAGMPGENLQWYEYGMALTSQGPELYRWMAPQGVETGSIANPDLQITRDEETKDTIYQLALPWGELAPIVPSDGILSLSIVVNENDSNVRKGYVEWGSGIGSSKQSSLFKPILLQKADLANPMITISGVESGENYTDQVTPIISVRDTGNGLKESKAWLDGVEWTINTPITGNGIHTLIVTAEDYAGNMATETVQFTIYYRTTLEVADTEASIEGEAILQATLRNRDGDSIEGQSITFHVNGLSVGEATTDATGKANFMYVIPINTDSGIKEVRAIYAQNDDVFLRGSEEIGKLTLYESAFNVPGKPILSNNNYDNGLLDGGYTITMDMWWGENGRIYKLYENGVLIHSQPMENATPNAQKTAVQVVGKSNGTYEYTCELINDKGTTECEPMIVDVTNVEPGKPILSNDNWDQDGAYKITMNMWWGTNATYYHLYENGQLIDTKQLTAATPNAQSVITEITRRTSGAYEYRAELVNASGVKESEVMIVTVI